MELPPDQHSKCDTCADDVLPLPFDAVNEILLCLPAKDLCRLRTVSRSWLSFLSNQRFIAEHTARHPGTHIVVGYNTALREDRVLYDICDLSGNIVKRVRSTGNKNKNELEWVLYTQPDLLCIVKWTDMMSIKLLNPATGVVHALPRRLAEEHAAYQQDVFNYCFPATFGQVASTGLYKVLRVIVILENGLLEQLYEVFTLDGSNHGRWRAKQAPPYQVQLDCRDNVVINGIVYFFLPYDVNEHKRRVASFNLETEEWSIPGPLGSLEDEDAGALYYHIHWLFQLTIGALSGSLVMACHPICSTPSSLDLWFLVDFKKGLWVKQYSIELSFRYPAYSIHPFLVLNDGRMLFVIDTVNSGGLLKIYNPETETSEDVMEMGYGVAVGLYTGSLLSLANSAS
ncbi:unnamed protein product [Urochloa humidicola]